MSRLSKKDVVRDFESGVNHSRKRKSEGKEEDVGNALFFVFRTETVGQGARVSGPLLKQKACDQLMHITLGTDYTPVYLTRAAEI